MTVPGAEDADLCGWHGGLIARFQLRAGRVSSWQLQPCTQAVAAHAVAATPDRWAAFAQRAAALAAAMAQAQVQAQDDPGRTRP